MIHTGKHFLSVFLHIRALSMMLRASSCLRAIGQNSFRADTFHLKMKRNERGSQPPLIIKSKLYKEMDGECLLN